MRRRGVDGVGGGSGGSISVPHAGEQRSSSVKVDP